MIARLATQGLAVLLVSTSGLTSAIAAESAEAKLWLERMSQALATRNYDGKFFHLRGEQTETLRIIHRVDGGKISERLVSLDGSGREVIRNDSEVICYLPDRKLVLVEQRTGDGPLFGALPSYSEGLDEHYDIEAVKVSKLLGRKTQMITVKPKDEFRYGYNLWIDYETAMPLKTQLCDRDGQVIEEILFATIDLPERIPLASLQPETSAEGVSRGCRRDSGSPTSASRRQPAATQPCSISCSRMGSPRCRCSSSPGREVPCRCMASRG
jgi:sigma-E factor negative regulatory protein RseB